MRKLFVVAVILAACGTDVPSPCEMEVADLYDRGCTFGRADGTRVDEAELRERCEKQIEESDRGLQCTTAIATCLGGAGLVCD